MCVDCEGWPPSPRELGWSNTEEEYLLYMASQAEFIGCVTANR